DLANELRVIETLGPSTIQPVVVSRRLPRAVKSELRRTFLSLADDPSARQSLAAALVQRFVPVHDRDYADLRSMTDAAATARWKKLDCRPRCRYGPRVRQRVGSLLPTYHFVDPDRGEGRRATLRYGIVPVDSQLLANGDGPLAVFGVMDADFRQAGVHRPLRLGSGGPHLRFDAIEQRFKVESFGALGHPPGRERPAGAGRPAIVVGHPFLAKRLLVGVLLDDIGVEPFCDPGKRDGP